MKTFISRIATAILMGVMLIPFVGIGVASANYTIPTNYYQNELNLRVMSDNCDGKSISAINYLIPRGIAIHSWAPQLIEQASRMGHGECIYQLNRMQVSLNWDKNKWHVYRHIVNGTFSNPNRRWLSKNEPFAVSLSTAKHLLSLKKRDGDVWLPPPRTDVSEPKHTSSEWCSFKDSMKICIRKGDAAGDVYWRVEGVKDGIMLPIAFPSPSNTHFFHPTHTVMLEGTDYSKYSDDKKFVFQRNTTSDDAKRHIGLYVMPSDFDITDERYREHLHVIRHLQLNYPVKPLVVEEDEEVAPAGIDSSPAMAMASSDEGASGSTWAPSSIISNRELGVTVSFGTDSSDGKVYWKSSTSANIHVSFSSTSVQPGIQLPPDSTIIGPSTWSEGNSFIITSEDADPSDVWPVIVIKDDWDNEKVVRFGWGVTPHYISPNEGGGSVEPTPTCLDGFEERQREAQDVCKKSYSSQVVGSGGFYAGHFGMSSPLSVEVPDAINRTISITCKSADDDCEFNQAQCTTHNDSHVVPHSYFDITIPKIASDTTKEFGKGAIKEWGIIEYGTWKSSATDDENEVTPFKRKTFGCFFIGTKEFELDVYDWHEAR